MGRNAGQSVHERVYHEGITGGFRSIGIAHNLHYATKAEQELKGSSRFMLEQIESMRDQGNRESGQCYSS